MKLVQSILIIILFVLLSSTQSMAQEALPENFEYPWRIEFQDKWIARNTQDPELVLNIPSNAIVRYCAGEIIPLKLEYVGNRGNVTFEIVPDEESEIGVRYEIREIQILCD
ncbi:MAG: hypothetical protein RBR42_07825 [Desulfomicrobium sp.]|nr:hypothetical protein [Desulfomicrobium sp.]